MIITYCNIGERMREPTLKELKNLVYGTKMCVEINNKVDHLEFNIKRNE